MNYMICGLLKCEHEGPGFLIRMGENETCFPLGHIFPMKLDREKKYQMWTRVYGSLTLNLFLCEFWSTLAKWSSEKWQMASTVEAGMDCLTILGSVAKTGEICKSVFRRKEVSQDIQMPLVPFCSQYLHRSRRRIILESYRQRDYVYQCYIEVTAKFSSGNIHTPKEPVFKMPVMLVVDKRKSGNMFLQAGFLWQTSGCYNALDYWGLLKKHSQHPGDEENFREMGRFLSLTCCLGSMVSMACWKGMITSVLRWCFPPSQNMWLEGKKKSSWEWWGLVSYSMSLLMIYTPTRKLREIMVISKQGFTIKFYLPDQLKLCNVLHYVVSVWTSLWLFKCFCQQRIMEVVKEWGIIMEEPLEALEPALRKLKGIRGSTNASMQAATKIIRL